MSGAEVDAPADEFEDDADDDADDDIDVDADDELDDDDDYDDDDDDEDDGDDGADPNLIVAPLARGVLEYLARSVVDDPDSVRVTVDDRSRPVAMSVTVAPGDMGRVIGKRGRVANAIRTVVGAAAVKDGVEVSVEFAD
ncbi:MAG: KH domain-containing protein [Acidimicrobiales bacterium]